jgi:Mn2+/Fe2+ NRAMP family transporter
LAGILKAGRDRLREHPLAKVGPGLITGVADDDPSGIATYSQAGAQYGLGMLWTMPLALPLMAAVQMMCASIGRVTGKGLAANIRNTFPPAVLYGIVSLLLVANICNIAADIAAMGEVAELVIGLPRQAMTVFFVAATLLLQVFVPYHVYVSYLKWLTLSLLAYAGVLFTVHVPWGEVAVRTIWPKLHLTPDVATIVVGVFERRSAPICSSGKPPRRSKTCANGTTRFRSSRILDRPAPNFAAFGGTPGAACSIPTSPPISSFSRPRSLCTYRA